MQVYTDRLRLREFSFETLQSYADWRRQGRQAAAPGLAPGRFPVLDHRQSPRRTAGLRRVGRRDDATLVVQLDAHLDIHHFRDCTPELSHGNFLLHCDGPLPPIVNAGHRDLLLPLDHIGRYYRRTFPAAELAIDPEPALAQLRRPARPPRACLSTWIVTSSIRSTSRP